MESFDIEREKIEFEQHFPFILQGTSVLNLRAKCCRKRRFASKAQIYPKALPLSEFTKKKTNIALLGSLVSGERVLHWAVTTSA